MVTFDSMKLKLVLLLLFFGLNKAFTQNETYTISWVDKRNVSTSEDKKIFVPGFESSTFYFDYQRNSISYVKNFKNLQRGKYQVTNIQYQPIDRSLLSNLKSIPTQFSYEVNQSRGCFLQFNPGS